MNRRDFLKRTCLAGAGIALARAPEVSARYLPGCLWGAFARPRGDETPESAILDLEVLIGRRLGLTRNYLNWTDVVPGYFAKWSAAGGRIPYLSWHSLTTGGCVPWAEIADGKHDSYLHEQGLRLKRWGRRAFFCFHHEPEGDADCGNAADFRAASRHVRKAFDRAGVSNLMWVVTLVSATYEGANGGPHAWLPDRYDLLGVDGYNRGPCSSSGEWRSFRDVFAPAHSFARASGRKLLIGESACVEADACGSGGGDPRAKAAWISDAGDTIASWPQVRGVAWSHTLASHDGFPEPFWVDTSPFSLAAFRSVGARGYFA